MFCPTCQTVSWTVPGTCPHCGGAMRVVTADDAVEFVEATAEVGTGEPAGDVSPPSEDNALAVTTPPARPALPAPVRLAELSIAAWRQPAVRAAIKTGASAVALSLAMRAARHVLARPPQRRAVTRSVVPSLSDLLQPEMPSDREHEHERGALVIETFVYMRRVVRR